MWGEAMHSKFNLLLVFPLRCYNAFWPRRWPRPSNGPGPCTLFPNLDHVPLHRLSLTPHNICICQTWLIFSSAVVLAHPAASQSAQPFPHFCDLAYILLLYDITHLTSFTPVFYLAGEPSVSLISFPSIPCGLFFQRVSCVPSNPFSPSLAIASFLYTRFPSWHVMMVGLVTPWMEGELFLRNFSYFHSSYFYPSFFSVSILSIYLRPTISWSTVSSYYPLYIHHIIVEGYGL